jgi:GNAT superfamily N-acetyltransferase
MPIAVREVDHADRDWVDRVLRECWGGPMVVADGQVFEAARLPGLMPAIGQGCCCTRSSRIVRSWLIDALEPHRGIGTALLAALIERLRPLGVQSLHLTTTNDNLDALRFYQRQGFTLGELEPGAIDRARALKPSIPAMGAYGIPIRDGLRLVRWLRDAGAPIPAHPSSS